MEDLEVEDIDMDDFNNNDDIVIEEPHIEVDSDKLSTFLEIAKNVADESGRDNVSKSVCMKVDKDILKLYVTDYDVFLEYEIDINNKKNVLQDTLVIPIEVITKLMKASLDEVIIYKSGENEYNMKLIGGDMVLETYEIDKDDFIYEGEIEEDKKVDSEGLYEIIDNFSSLVTSAVSATERRIICENDSVYASYMWAMIKSEFNSSDMDIKVDDIKVLKKVLKGREEELTVYDSEGDKVDRKVIEGDNFKYVFLVSDLSISDTKKNSIDNAVIDDGLYLDYDYLYKIVELSAELPYATGKMNVNFSEGDLKIEILTISEDKNSEFIIKGTEAGNIGQLDDDLIVQAEFFRSLLKSFSGYSSIKVSLTDDGIGFYTDKYQAVLSSSV